MLKMFKVSELLDARKEKVSVPDFYDFPIHKRLSDFKRYSDDILNILRKFYDLEISFDALKKLQSNLQFDPTPFELKVINSFWSCGKGHFNRKISEIQIASENPHIIDALSLYNNLRQSCGVEYLPRTLKDVSNMGYVAANQNGLHNIFNTYGKSQMECGFYDKGIRSSFYLSLNTIWDTDSINGAKRAILNSISNGTTPIGAIYKEYAGGSFHNRINFSKYINGLEVPIYECPACMDTKVNMPVSKISVLGYADKPNINSQHVGYRDRIVLVKPLYASRSIKDFYSISSESLSGLVTRVVSCNDGIINSLIDALEGFSVDLSKMPLGEIDVEELLLKKNQDYIIVLTKNKNMPSLKDLLRTRGFDCFQIGSVTRKKCYRLVNINTELMKLDNEIVKYHMHDYNIFRIEDKCVENSTSLYEAFDEEKIGEYIRKNLALGRFYPNNVLNSVSSGQCVCPQLIGHRQLTPMQAMPLSPRDNRFEDACAMMTSNINNRIGKSEFAVAVNAVVSAVLKLVVLGVPLCDTAISANLLYDVASNKVDRGGVLVKSLACLYAQDALSVGSMCNSIELMHNLHSGGIVTDITAIGTCNVNNIITTLFKKGDKLYYFSIPRDQHDIPDFKYVLKLASQINININVGNITAGRIIEYNIVDSIIKGTAGDGLGFSFAKIDESIFIDTAGGIILAINDEWDYSLFNAEYLGVVDDSGDIKGVTKIINQNEIERIISKYPFENDLYNRVPVVEPRPRGVKKTFISNIDLKALVIHTEDSAEKCFAEVLNKLNYSVSSVRIPTDGIISQSFAQKLRAEISHCDMLICAGRRVKDAPCCGIYNALHNPIVLDALNELVFNREGLVLGTGEGARALLELGYLAVGNAELGKPKNLELIENNINETSARLPRIKVVNNHSPFLKHVKTDFNYVVAHAGEKFKFSFTDEVRRVLTATGQISMQFVDNLGYPTVIYPENPYGSQRGIAALSSPDGKMLGLFFQPELTTKLLGEKSLLVEMLKSSKKYYLN